MRSLRSLAWAVAGCVLVAGCRDGIPTAGPAPQSTARQRAILTALGEAGYHGPVSISERTAQDQQGRHQPFWSFGVPQADVQRVRQALGRSAEAAGSIRRLIGPSPSPDNADPSYNTPTSALQPGYSVGPSILNRGIQAKITTTTTFYTYDYSTDTWYQIPAGDILGIQVQGRDFAGGHHHGYLPAQDSIRRGYVSPRKGPLAGGAFTSTWYAPEFASEVDMVDSLRYVPRGETNPVVDLFFDFYPSVTRVPGLSQMPEDSAWDLVGGTASHPQGLNDWGQPGLIGSTMLAAWVYNFWTGDRTRVNDISLFYGGRFDVGLKVGAAFTRCGDASLQVCWGNSHKEHRLGTEVDLRPVNWGSATARADFKTVLYLAGFKSVYVEGDHFHARSPASPYNP
jgi:hypothetical protein